MTSAQKTATAMAAYKVGETDTRPWGGYTVTGVGETITGEEYCEKEITVNPRQVLSLQSHDHRREMWRVVSGTLTVLKNDTLLTLCAGEVVELPQGALHCMANLDAQTPAVVFERQEGICREEDIHRFADAYGRAGETPQTPEGLRALEIYTKLLKDIGA